jgi:hypothetical protein
VVKWKSWGSSFGIILTFTFSSWLLTGHWPSHSVYILYMAFGFFFIFITLHFLLQFLSYPYPSRFLNSPFLFLTYVSFHIERGTFTSLALAVCKKTRSPFIHSMSYYFIFLFIRCIRWTIFTYNGTPFWPLANRVLWKVFSIHYFSPSDLCVSECVAQSGII